MKGQTVVLFNGTELGTVSKESELKRWMSVYSFDRQPVKVQFVGGNVDNLEPINGGPEKVFSRVGNGISNVPGLHGPAEIVRFQHKSGDFRLAFIPPRMLRAL